MATRAEAEFYQNQLEKPTLAQGIVGGLSKMEQAYMGHQVKQHLASTVPGLAPFLEGMPTEDALKLWAQLREKQMESESHHKDDTFSKLHALAGVLQGEGTWLGLGGVPKSEASSRRLNTIGAQLPQVEQLMANELGNESGGTDTYRHSGAPPLPDIPYEKPKTLLEGVFGRMTQEDRPLEGMAAHATPDVQGLERAARFFDEHDRGWAGHPGKRGAPQAAQATPHEKPVGSSQDDPYSGWGKTYPGRDVRGNPYTPKTEKDRKLEESFLDQITGRPKRGRSASASKG